MSAVVRAKTHKNDFVQARVLLDTCATAHFITDQLVKLLKLRTKPCSVSIGTMSSNSSIATRSVQVTFQASDTNFQKTLTFLVVPKIADKVPSSPFPRDVIKLPNGCRLADPQFHIPRPIDMLIGSGATLSMLSIGQINLSKNGNDLFLQKTLLGWCVVGGVESSGESATSHCNVTELLDSVSKFWESEEVGAFPKTQTQKEIECEKHYVDNVERLSDGRYQVRLPFAQVGSLANTRTVALRRLNILKDKFKSNPNLKEDYSRVMQEYISLNHMTLSEDADLNDGYYLPHHAVVKTSSTTTKTRVVFDGSARTRTGKSLNDNLLVGPTIQPKLFDHLVRIRFFCYVFMADIEKMYRQVLVHKDDRKFQRVFWLVNDEIKTFELNTVTFGISSAPFLAIRTLHKLAQDEEESFPEAAKALTRDFYVDDFLSGSDDVEKMISLRDQLIQLLSRGGFNIRQWASNNRDALNGLPGDAINSKLTLDKDATLKTLGITWHSTTDSFVYTVKPIQIPNKITKRHILSEVAKIFDPLGLLGPVIFEAKAIVQMAWKEKIGWDESVPLHLNTTWTKFAKELELINNLTIPRYVTCKVRVEIELHGFCDASKRGYGACLYVRTRQPDDKVTVNLIAAKSSVAPTKKPLTIPRAELCAAKLLTRLYCNVISALTIPITKATFWSDSTIVLCWIKTDTHVLQSFVSNRVSKIQERAGTHPWRHIRSKENPADELSRGQSPSKFLDNRKWFHGPSWLKENESEWPQGTEPLNNPLPEMKKVVALATVLNTDIFSRFSSYSKLVRSLYCLRFVMHCLRARKLNIEPDVSIEKKLELKKETEKLILRSIQATQFADEIAALSDGGQTVKPRLASLNPFIDHDGLLRVGGRLINANIPEYQKCQILLPSHHHVTDLIIRETHESFHHTGILSTYNHMRQRFWLLDANNQIRNIIRHCVRCFRFKAEPAQYKMGPLPKERVNGTRPFLHIGTDYCGPILIKEKKFRNRGKVKIWVCVFICLATRAVHFELASELSTLGFLAAFKRFIARRARPLSVHSDNGTNYKGANNQLRELFALVKSSEFEKTVGDFALKEGIAWHFSPPLSPHFGGIFEAAVKSFKHHFRRVVGDRLFTFEEIYTFACEIEAILNSRPICSLSSDPNDPQALTPAHFLVGHPMTLLPDENLLYVPDNKLASWRLIDKARQDFWKRWQLECLNELQIRQKWLKNWPNLEVGQVVLIKDKNLSCARWLLGRVSEVHPGADGVVRAATVRTATSQYKRCVKLLCPLPIQ